MAYPIRRVMRFALELPNARVRRAASATQRRTKINVVVAAGTLAGIVVKLQISMNGVTSRPDVTIAVSQ